MSDLILVKQLPILEERFKEMGQEIERKTSRAAELVVSEENYKDIKKIRATLNKEATAYATEFRGIKDQVLAPWKAVEDSYKENIELKYKESDRQLKEKINGVENELKEMKRAEIENLFDELCVVDGIDFVSFEQSGIKINLSDSKKKLKDQVRDFVSKIASDLELIDTQEHQAEILAEYKKCLDVNAAIVTVNQRIEAEERQRKILEERRVEKTEGKVHKEEVERHLGKPMTVPTPIADKPSRVKKRSVTFTVYFDKVEEAKRLATFLAENGYDYEQL